MANTINTLTYANTFGHWLAATDALIAENNILASDDYTKDSGTIYLSEGTLTALQSNGNVIVQKALSVSGPNSSATVEKDLTVQRQGLFTNTGTSISATGNVIVGNVLHVNGTGYGIQVDADAKVDGDLYVGGNLDLDVLEARTKINTATLSVTGTTYTNKLQSNNQIVTGVLTANGDIYTSRVQANTRVVTTEIQANTTINAATISVTTGIYGNSLQANSSVNTSNASIVGTTYTKFLQANSSVNTANASITGTTYTNTLIANTELATPTAYITANAYVSENMYVTGDAFAYDVHASNTMFSDVVFSNTVYIQNNSLTIGNTNSTSFFASSNVTSPTIYSGEIFGDYLTANLKVYTPGLDVEGTTLTQNLQANSSVNTANASITGTTYSKYVVANTQTTTAALAVTNKTFTGSLQANNYANTQTLSVTERALIDRVQANTSVNTDIVSVATITYSKNVQANTGVNAAVISVTGNTYTNRVQANSSVNTASLFVTETITANDATLFVNNIQVLDELSVEGNFVINGDTVYNSNTFTLNSGAVNAQISSFVINRGTDGANAEIKWNEPSKQFEILNVTDSEYYRILTNEHLSDSITSTSSTVVATSAAANTLNDNIQTANTYLKNRVTSAESFANGSFLRANASYTAQNTTANFANAAYRHANSAYAAANNVAPQVAPSFNHANAAFDKANTTVASIKGTTGTATASNAGLTFKSNNGVVIYATNDNSSGNTLSISTPQNLQTSASPTFAGLSLTTPLAVGQGGTGTTSYASLFGLAVTAAAGGGSSTAGKVLSADGSGGYSWVTGGSGGGGGTQPGSRISSNRLSYTADGTTWKYTAPTFSVGSQVRPYINGVRQFESEYWAESTNTTVGFLTVPTVGDKILIEVDGYAIYEYFANNIVYGPASGDMVGATIQDAIDNLESRKIAKVGGTFTGVAMGLTMPTTVGNTAFATTKYVNDLANSSYTFTHDIDGNAKTVTNGVYTSSSYDNPSWLTAIAPSKLNDVIPDNKLADKVTAGAHGNGTANTLSITVDAKGRVTAISNTAISIKKSQISDFPALATSATTDTTDAANITKGTLPSARLGDSGVTAATYGGTNKVAKVTVNAKGIVTGAEDAQISITKSQVSDFPTLATSATTDTTDAGNISKGTLASARLPSGIVYNTGATFSGDVSVGAGDAATGKATLSTSGDITTYRKTDTTGYLYLNKAKDRYLGNDGSKYILAGQGLEVNGSNVLNASDNFTITGTRNYKSTTKVGTDSQSGTLVCYGDNGAIGTNHATMSFHRPGSYAINMGLDNDDYFRIGGWSDGLNKYRMQLDKLGNVTFANNVTAYSDTRLKTNVNTIENALDTVSKLRGVTYERIDSGSKGIGVIAQEIREVLPEVVVESAPIGDQGEGEGYLSVSYGNIVGVLIEAIKELKEEIEVLKGQIK